MQRPRSNRIASATAVRFIEAWQTHGSVRRAMREAGIGSPTTAYRLLTAWRAHRGSPDWVTDRLQPTSRVPPAVACEIVQVRRAHPDWGKLRISRQLRQLHDEDVVSPGGVRSVLRTAGLWHPASDPPSPPGSGARYPPELRERARLAITAGAPIAQLSRVYGIDPGTLRRWCPVDPDAATLGRAPLIPQEEWHALRDQVAAHPGATLRDHCAIWLRDRGTSVSPSVMSRTLGRIGVTPASRGRPLAIPPSLWPALRIQVAIHPDATLRDHCALWASDHGTSVSEGTMSRLFKRLGLPRPGRRNSLPSPNPVDERP